MASAGKQCINRYICGKIKKKKSCDVECVQDKIINSVDLDQKLISRKKNFLEIMNIFVRVDQGTGMSKHSGPSEVLFLFLQSVFKIFTAFLFEALFLS